MKRIKERSIAFAAALALTLITITASAPNAEASTRYKIITGRVLRIDTNKRQMLVADRSSEKLYLVNVPESAALKITFGRSMQMSAPTLEDVSLNNIIQFRCARTDKEHFARLYDGREVIEVIAAH